MLFTVLVLAAVAAAQLPENAGSFPVGTRTISVAGAPGGNTSVSMLVHYPATSSGASTPLQTASAPYPVIVFGHGFSLSADLYATLYAHWASHGFVVAAPTTESGLFTGNLPKFLVDMQATVLGLRAAAAAPASWFFGGVTSDVRGVAAGHSFGGAAALVAASARPDLFLAVTPMAATATSPQGVDILAATAALTVPVLSFGASTDTIVPPSQNLDVIHAAVPTTKLLVEIAGGTHSYFHEAWYLDRLAEPAGLIPVAQQQLLVRRYATAFFDWQSRAGTKWLNALAGPPAHADAGLSRYENLLLAPVLFAEGPAVSGQTYTVHPTWQPGDGTLFAFSTAAANAATPYGTLLIDVAGATLLDLGLTGPNGYATASAVVPGGPPYSGLTVYSQALIYRTGASALSNALVTTIP